MKRVLALILVLAMTFSMFVGCSSDSTKSSSSNNSGSSSTGSSDTPSSSGSAKDITVTFIPKLTGNAFFESANKGAQKFAENGDSLLITRVTRLHLLQHR